MISNTSLSKADGNIEQGIAGHIKGLKIEAYKMKMNIKNLFHFIETQWDLLKIFMFS